MRLLRKGPVGEERPAVLDANGQARDLSGVITDIGPAFFDDGGVARLQGLRAAGRLDDLPVLDGTARIGSPVSRPGKIVCVGLNYRDHAEESGMTIPDEPVLFFKAPDTVVGPDDDVRIPPDSVKTDWEAELGVVIGTRASYLPDQEAATAAIAGYAVSHDVSERHYQLERGGQWVKGKSCETFNPLGPWLVTPDEVADPQALRVWLSVNDQLMQDGNTKNMIFPVARVVWYVSQFMVLEPGDLINTGTPAGVGMGRTPQRYLRPGDRVRLGVDGLGEQHQQLIQTELPTPSPSPNDHVK